MTEKLISGQTESEVIVPRGYIVIPKLPSDMLTKYQSGDYRSPQYSFKTQGWTIEPIPNTDKGGH